MPCPSAQHVVGLDRQKVCAILVTATSDERAPPGRPTCLWSSARDHVLMALSGLLVPGAKSSCECGAAGCSIDTSAVIVYGV
jgi:hypothetical protein